MVWKKIIFYPQGFQFNDAVELIDRELSVKYSNVDDFGLI